MPAIPVHLRSSLTLSANSANTSPLPTLLQTPAGLAILEIQGTLNTPQTYIQSNHGVESSEGGTKANVPVGHLVFPGYRVGFESSNEGGQASEGGVAKAAPAWMNRVFLYVGQHQRLTGEVKTLSKPLGIIRRRGGYGTLDPDGTSTTEEQSAAQAASGSAEPEDLELAGVVRYKIVFASRPEPVAGTGD